MKSVPFPEHPKGKKGHFSEEEFRALAKEHDSKVVVPNGKAKLRCELGAYPLKKSIHSVTRNGYGKSTAYYHSDGSLCVTVRMPFKDHGWDSKRCAGNPAFIQVDEFRLNPDGTKTHWESGPDRRSFS